MISIEDGKRNNITGLVKINSLLSQPERDPLISHRVGFLDGFWSGLLGGSEEVIQALKNKGMSIPLDLEREVRTKIEAQMKAHTDVFDPRFTARAETHAKTK